MSILQPNRVWPIVIGLLSLLNPLSAWSAKGCPAIENLTAPSLIEIDPTLAVGSVVGQMSVFFPAGTSTCGYGAGRNFYSIDGVGVPNGNLYPTNIPGIAYRGKFTANWSGKPLQDYWPVSMTNNDSEEPAQYGYGWVNVDFIKTGPISAGKFGQQKIVSFTINGNPFFDVYLNGESIVAPVTPACDFAQSATSITLEETSTSQLSTVGSTSKDQQFYIPLNCSSNTNVSLSFSGDMADSANAVFRNLSGSANANSVGVQILSGGKPVPTAINTYLNLGPVNGSISVPLTARYYSLNSNSQVGAVSSVVTANIFYN
jgi:type 1 fimbria pilin